MTDVVGLRFVTEGERDATEAIKRYTTAQKDLTRSVLDGASRIQGISAAWDRANRLYGEGVINANALRSAQMNLAREMAVLNGYVTKAGSLNTQKALAELRAAQATREHAEATKRQIEAAQRAQQGYDRLRASIDPVFAAQQRMRQAHETVRQALANETITRQQAAQTLLLYRQRLREVNQQVVTTTDFTGRLRTQFLATANTIAILDGPLGGIASRFSAFGVLIGRTGVILGGVAVAMTALAAVAGRGVRSFTQFEVQAAKINAVLENTGAQVGFTGQQIERMAAGIALSTLESEQGVRAAAMRLLSFRDIAGQVFEDVLKTASDMAALGFGTIESETIKLAKALEDPAQALTSLSRAGIVFTRQQRAMIISLVDSGDRLGAMDRILENVNRRVGGAGEAAARDTFAGALDTIGQAAGRAVREFGEFIVEAAGVGAAVKALANLAAPFAAGPPDDATVLRGLTEQRRALDEMEVVRNALSTAMLEPRRNQITQEYYDREAARLDESITQLREKIRLEEAITRARQQQTQVDRTREGIDNLQAEIDLRRTLVGLSEEEQRARRALAGEGLLRTQEQITQQMVQYRNALAEAGVEHGIINTLVAQARADAESLTSLYRDYVNSLKVGREVQEATRAAESQQQRLEQLSLELSYLRQGYDLAEARKRVEDDLALVMYENVLAMSDLPDETRKSVEEAVRFLDVMRATQNAVDAVVESQRVMAGMTDRRDSLEEELAILDAQIVLLEQGVDFTISQRLAEIEVQKARIQTQIITEGITEELQTQLALLNAMSGTVIEIGARQARVSGFRPSRGGGGRGREPTDIQTTIDQMDTQLNRQRALLDMTEQQRGVMEIYYRLLDANQKADIQMSEERLMQQAELFAAREREIAQLEQAREANERLATQIGNTLGNLFMAATEGANSLRNALAGVLRNLASMLANGAFRALMAPGGPGGGLTGALGTLAGGLLGFGSRNAHGNVFYGGNVIPFANGGVVGSPTAFPMRGGRTGLMGEAGPEAIMPLRRGRDGKLGVSARPQEVAVDVRVYMDENGQWQTSVERIADRRVQRAAPTIVRQSVSATYAANSERRMR